ncbi:MAG: glycosyl hydrolase [Sphingobacteriales bacterium]|nr:MAG: glycosyl hydrolase [Sphingobacteriales bacterium]
MRKYISLLPLLLLAFVISYSQKNKKTESKAEAKMNYDSVFQSLKWRNIGPFRGGRANTICGVPSNDQLFYVGYTGGGVWRTDDGGINWKNISDGFFKVGSIGDIAVCEGDPNVVYVGTGEHAVRGVMTSYGDGVYKSTDGGKTWKNIGLQNTRHISEVVVHPANPDIVYVGAQGTVHGPNSDRGVYKSTDGGATWRKVLFVNDSTGVSSLSMDMHNPRILYAATWQHERLPWKVVSGGKGCAIWKSTDAGETWNKIVDGLPDEMGKIGVSVSRANPNRVFAIVEAEKSKAGLYRSDNGGKSWTLMSNNQLITSRSWYYMKVYADPKDENLVYVLNAPMTKSIDGGKTFAPVGIGHGDTHDLWINPNYTGIIGLADDGGGSITYNNAKSWSTLMNQPTAQFYRVNVDNRFPYWVYGGQQDNTSVMTASRNNSFGLTERDWMYGPGCESAWIAFDPNNPTQYYGGCYQGYIEVMDAATKSVKDIQAYPSVNLAVEPKKMKYRFNWNAPIVASPHDPHTIYHAGNVLLKTTNGGMSWEAISPDLTRNDSTKQGQGGGPISNEGAGGENYNTIYYVTESALEKGVIWTGSDCGLVYVTMNGGQSWTNVTPAGLPECIIHSIELSPHDKATAYISATRYKFNDYASYTFKTTDYGKTWTKITNGVDTDDFIKVIREDKKVKDLLYAGSERGFYISFNGGANWNKVQLNLPVVPVTDLMIHDNDLVAATAGRAFWILDDLGSVQQSKGSITDSKVKLFTPKPAYHYSGSSGDDGDGAFGKNPLQGVILDYYLPEKADTNLLKLEIMDANNKLVKTFTNKKDDNYKAYPGGPAPAKLIPAQKGLNRFAWDLNGEDIKPDVPGAYVMGGYSGYALAPGKYTIRLSYKGNSSEVSAEVLQDPALKVTMADWNEQQQFLASVSAEVSSIHTAINDMRKVKQQIETYNELMKDATDNKEVVEKGKEVIKKIDTWESNLIETRQKNFQDVINFPSKLNVDFVNLKGLADAHDPRITKGLKDRLADLEKQWNKYKAVYDNELRKAIDDYNALFKQKNLPAIIR